MRRPRAIFELAALAVAVVVAWLAGGIATDAWLARVAQLGLAAPAADVVRGLGQRANLYFTLAVIVLGGARALAHGRAPGPLAVPYLVPAAVFASLLGLIIHHATVEVVDGRILAPTAVGFAGGFLLGAVVAAALLVAPIDLGRLATRLCVPIGLSIAAIFVALAVAGSGPGGSGTRINLGPVQPIEVVKPLVVLFLAGFLGKRAAKLRWQRRRVLGLRWPRLALLVPALLAVVGCFAGLFVVGDLGPVLLLAAVFLGMFYLVTRATGWAVAALALVAAMLAVIAVWPGLVETGRVATRIRIWRDPWTNGLTHGHQVGEGLWSIAAGGPAGQGLAQAHVPLPPAGKTDLILAPLIEQLGAVGALAYLALLTVLVLGGLRVAARGRTPERVLIAGGASLLLVVQWALIHAGSFGVLPLTGIVVPFLSSGRTSMIAFLLLIAIVVRLSQDGPPRERTDELDELSGGARGLAGVAVVLLGTGAGLVLWTTVVARSEVAARGIVARLADGTLEHRQNPRLLAIARALRRGTIADRHGAPIAITEGEVRRYPLGAALGTLVGIAPSRVLRAPWALERLLDPRLRGYGVRAGGPRYRAFDPRGPDAPLPWPDLRALVPLLARSPAARATAVRVLADDVAARSVRVTLDAGLQRAIAALIAPTLTAGRGAAVAVVVIEVDTGAVLARVQAPDYDPGDGDWQDRVLAGDAAFTRRFHGAYGAWPDKTGVQGMFQAGSVAKLFTALAAVRHGAVIASGAGCRARSTTRYACDQRDAQGPMFTRPGWPRPIHDHGRDPIHGQIELAGAIAVSCNVYFGQLGLELGPDPLVALRAAGVDIGYAGGGFDPGPAGTRALASSGFGQGAMVMSPMQAARLVAALAAGGRYRRCPPSMEQGAPCDEVSLVDDPAALAPILAGMRLVMTDGTGARLTEPSGLRVYGKSGTADVRGFRGEAPFGIAPGQDAPPHAWFVAFAEPTTVPACAVVAPGRLAVAVVVPRGGAGAATAGPIAMKVLAAARALGYLAAAE